jgi:hypothetical protein
MEGIYKMTIAELQFDRETKCPLDLPRHSVEVPELSLGEMFYPLGFPTILRTNSPEILLQAGGLWSIFRKRFDTKPISVDVHLVDAGSAACPPTPVVRLAKPLLINIADANNHSVADLDRVTTQIILSRAAIKHRSYMDYFFLSCAPLCHIAGRYTTPVHAGCVVRNGRGVLLCGDSGAGKSTLSYACARAGWTYVTDDASYMLNNGEDRLMTGNCHQVRFRPSALKLFPELDGLEITPRAAGKPSIELPTDPMPGITRATTAQVDYLVFLNRRASGTDQLVSYRRDAARQYLRQVLYGPDESVAMQYAALERLLTAEIFELRYSNLDWAVSRLESLTREGR